MLTQKIGFLLKSDRIQILGRVNGLAEMVTQSVGGKCAHKFAFCNQETRAVAFQNWATTDVHWYVRKAVTQ